MGRIRKYPYGNCSNCPLDGKIIKDGLCYSCYQDERILIKIIKIENNFSPNTEYNQNIFTLYLTYIKRYRLTYSIKNQAIALATLLQNEKIITINSWFDIYRLSEEHKIYQKGSTAKGRAFVKIGKMLQELGVLSPREDEKERETIALLSCFPKQLFLKEFIASLHHIGTSKETIIDYLYSLKDLTGWLLKKKNYDIPNASCADFKEFIEHLTKERSNNYVRNRYNHLRRYYKWLYFKRHIEKDKIPSLKINRDQVKINILDDYTVKKLFAFIRNPKSNPEFALMITLTLIWGTKRVDLAHAQLIIKENGFDIKFRRKELTKGRKYYNRPEVLKLPKESKWLFGLQKRYLNYWQAHYRKIKKTYPRSPLFLHRTLHSNNFLCSDTLGRRFFKATTAATGTKITNLILRQTCGHLASLSGDASVLSHLGWSDQFAFHYTWLPREIWTK